MQAGDLSPQTVCFGDFFKFFFFKCKMQMRACNFHPGNTPPESCATQVVV